MKQVIAMYITSRLNHHSDGAIYFMAAFSSTIECTLHMLHMNWHLVLSVMINELLWSHFYLITCAVETHLCSPAS